MKAQKIDKGYPRRTDAVFGGVPNDAHDVFLYKGIENVASVSSAKRGKVISKYLICESFIVYVNKTFLYILGHFYFCRDRFYWRMNARRQVDRVGYVKYDLLMCSDPSGTFY